LYPKKSPGTSPGLESTFVWVEETLGGESQSYTRLTTNMVIVSRIMVRCKKIDQNQVYDAF